MDCQALIRTYGNANLPHGTPDRPLVTFAVFAYNQEKYIRKAVEGAFSQIYSPLEIILSDDCSSDRTFEIMEEMAREYSGPHLVKVRRGGKNKGLAGHINAVIAASDGDIISWAAGDDIALPERTDRLVTSIISDKNIVAAHSAVTEIDTQGALIRQQPHEKRIRAVTLEDVCRDGQAIVSQSHAFRRSVFDFFGDLDSEVTNEGIVMAFRELVLGDVAYVEEPLTLYRIGSGTSTYREKDMAAIRFAEPKKVCDWYLSAFKQISADANRVKAKLSARQLNLINKNISLFENLLEINSNKEIVRNVLRNFIISPTDLRSIRAAFRIKMPPSIYSVAAQKRIREKADRVRVIVDRRIVNQSMEPFESLDYYPYLPKVQKIDGEALVTRSGIVFGTPKIVWNSLYRASPSAVVRGLALGIASRIKRDQQRFQNKENFGIIHSPWTAGYYHWITESLPRAIVLHNAEPLATPLIPANTTIDICESLAAIGFSKVEFFPDNKNIVARNLLVTSCPPMIARMAPELLIEMRERVWRYYSINPKTPQRLVYVSRRRARGRKVRNEEQVCELLLSRGFEIFCFEDISFSEQVRLMSEARALVGIHGAALTNIAFMPSNSAVLELLAKRHPVVDYGRHRHSWKQQSCYVRLADVFGHSYRYLECASSAPIFRRTDLADIVVDIEKLRLQIDELIS